MDKENYTIDISDLVPTGIENAISRKDLTQKCLSYGLIDEKSRDADRAMRLLLAKAKENHVIINLQDGSGYFQPSKDDYHNLNWYISQEQQRALAIFKPLRYAEKVRDEMRKERQHG